MTSGIRMVAVELTLEDLEGEAGRRVSACP